MQSVKITVTDVDGSKETRVETRFVDVETDRRLTGDAARRILQREYPEIGFVSFLSKNENGWSYKHALKPTAGCDYHFVWRRYRLDLA